MTSSWCRSTGISTSRVLGVIKWVNPGDDCFGLERLSSWSSRGPNLMQTTDFNFVQRDVQIFRFYAFLKCSVALEAAAIQVLSNQWKPPFQMLDERSIYIVSFRYIDRGAHQKAWRNSRHIGAENESAKSNMSCSAFLFELNWPLSVFQL